MFKTSISFLVVILNLFMFGMCFKLAVDYEVHFHGLHPAAALGAALSVATTSMVFLRQLWREW